MILESNSPEETSRIAEKLGMEAKPGEIYCLDGDLGVGKTVFTQGFAKGLGVDDIVNSPTFTIVKEYEGRIPLYHFDMYRLGDSSELEEIGYEEYFYGKGVCIVEWPERVDDILPDDVRYVRITKDLERGFDYRKIECQF